MTPVPWFLATAAALCAASWAAGQAVDEAASNVPTARAGTEVGDPAERLAQATDAATAHARRVESAHIRFRRTRMTGPFLDGISPAGFDELLKAHDLVAHPDSLREFLLKLLATETVADEPWSEMELHTAHPGTPQQSVRETRTNRDGEPDVHVVTPDFSLRWDEANSQFNIDAAGNNRVAYTRLAEFRRPAPANLPRADVRAEQFDGRAALRVDIVQTASTFVVDEATGFLLRRDSQGGNQVELSRWLGWQTTPAGVPFPRAVVVARFEGGRLRWLDVCLVREARFNMPLSPTVFRLGAPAGSVIVGRGGRDVTSINRDVFDASSDEQVAKAAAPLNEEYTQTELDAFDELRQIYVLTDGEAVKRFSPPFSLARNYLPRMISKGTMPTRRRFRYYVFDWQDEKLKTRMSYTGITPRTSHLIDELLHQPETAIEIPTEALQRELPGDYLVRHDATEEELADGLSEILSHELQRPVRLVFREVNRRVFVARGRLESESLATSERFNRPLIAVNGGDHAGDHGEQIGFGRLSDLLRDVGDYVGHKIVNKTEPSGLDLAWSKRWYDLDSTPAEKRFQLDPQAVVKIVAAQTGLTIEPDVQRVRVLRLLDR